MNELTFSENSVTVNPCVRMNRNVFLAINEVSTSFSKDGEVLMVKRLYK